MNGRLLFLTTGLAYGGAETQLVRLATRLRARGWGVRVVSMLPPQAFAEELEAAGIPLATLNMRRGVPDPRALFRLASILRRDRPQVVHSHMVHANLLARLARPLARVPVLVCTAHNINEGGRHREWAYRLTDFFCDLTTQVSQAGLERYVRVGAVPRHKIRFIPNGVDTDHFRPNPEAGARLRHELGLGSAFAWLAVGRIEGAKDYPNMLRAFARVLRERGDTVLLIAGQGSLREEAEQLANQLGLREKVHFLGVRKDVPELMNAADAYVMSSAWEGMPMVLLEAAATGLPIVATDVGGNREVVLDEQSGFLVPPEDLEALARAMLHLMDLSLEERQRMGEFGRRYIEENYSLDRVVDQWEALYMELLGKKGLGKVAEK
ncbi:Glycosyltransferase involved in cell wall bisynthesis [Desulfofundulus australicus DSM 11792]|uniref:Glycosyltransferase involved in cell wall bisynthesis n=1 Tax=Desulfofundulus australicus DSM 11792 TaxID=1121425 RepID=A0A1M4VFM2_9FIRM|nr:Glycosyltransferase involved in cell wall bisynthesis [Desulfofundulus australicus DSM 11792]